MGRELGKKRLGFGGGVGVRLECHLAGVDGGHGGGLGLALLRTTALTVDDEDDYEEDVSCSAADG